MSNNYQPLVSVVTAVYNGEKFLQGCIDSVVGQTYPNLEHIVIDGGSTDGTLDIIRNNASISYWLSEPDSGISHAMNKGVNLAKGEYVVFIHSDDYLYSESALENVVKHLRPECKILLAPILYGQHLSLRVSRGLDYWTNFKTGVCHQGALCHKSVFLAVEGFDQTLKIAMDYDFFLKVYRCGIRAEFCDVILSVMRDTGVTSSRDWLSLEKRFKEEEIIHYSNVQSLRQELLYRAYWAMYWRYKKLMCRRKDKFK